MKKKILTALLVIVLICALGFASFIGCLKYTEQYNIGLREGMREGKLLGYEESYSKGLEQGYINGSREALAAEREDTHSINSVLTLREFQKSKVSDVTISNAFEDYYVYQISIRGKIIDISGRVLTLAAEEDTLSICIDEAAAILIYAPGEEVIIDYGPFSSTLKGAREVKFEELKIGDEVEMDSTLRIARNTFDIHYVFLSYSPEE